jgi:hypothetical protein
MLHLRARATRLRLQRQLRPDAPDEPLALRHETQETVSDDVLHKLRSQPVLLREVAAEIGKEDARVTRAAIDTLGLAVATDTQAQALGHAIATLNTTQPSPSLADLNLTDVVNRFQQADFDPDVIRKWVTTDFTATDTQVVGRSLGSNAPNSAVLGDFENYFRAGVDGTLRGTVTPDVTVETS